jgi:hypothetical protein
LTFQVVIFMFGPAALFVLFPYLERYPDLITSRQLDQASPSLYQRRHIGAVGRVEVRYLMRSPLRELRHAARRSTP